MFLITELNQDMILPLHLISINFLVLGFVVLLLLLAEQSLVFPVM